MQIKILQYTYNFVVTCYPNNCYIAYSLHYTSIEPDYDGTHTHYITFTLP